MILLLCAIANIICCAINVYLGSYGIATLNGGVTLLCLSIFIKIED